LSGSETVAAQPTRELAAIMFSDIAGYTAIMGRNEHEAMRALDAHRGTLRAVLPKFNGRLIGEIGDGTLSSFHSAIDAVNCAREVQALAEDNPELRLRIGIHLGDVVFTNNTVIGDGVNVASRIHGLAPPGGICISEHVYEAVRNKPGTSAKDLGRKKLKNVPSPVHIYLIGPSGLATLSANTRLARIIGIGVAAIVLIVALTIVLPRLKPRLYSAPQAVGPTHPIRSIAVLPLDNFSGDPSQEYFADGMTDELTTDLASISALKVISRGSVMRYKGANRPPTPEIAKALNVDAVVEGSVMRSGNRVRITAQLIDAPNDKHLWAKSFERDSPDLLALQDEIASAIAHEIDVQLTPHEQARLQNPRSVNPEAYDAYLRGRYFFNGWTEEGINKALDQYALAIKADPNFAPAYAGIADAYLFANEMYVAPKVAVPKAKAAVEKSLALTDSAEAHTSLALIKESDYDWAGADREFARAIELNPNYALSYDQRAWLLGMLGRFDEALASARRAAELDPLSPGIPGDESYVLSAQGRYEEAIEQARKGIELDPNGYYSRCTLAGAYAIAGRYRDAIRELEKARSMGAPPFFWGFLGAAYAAVGERDKAEAIIADLQAASAKRYVSPLSTAMVYGGLGDRQRALDWMEKAYEAHSAWLPLMIKGALSQNLRDEPRYLELLKKVNLAG
jgi:adenylate cyclase